MNGKKIAIVFIVLDICLIAAIVFLFCNQDRTAPEITFSENNAEYSMDMDRSLLFEGVTAYDNLDGDITELVLIEKETVNTGKQFATVTYAVIDSSGNVTKKSRVFPLKIS